ncbi:hypothetical protein Glove_54g110 [Diversispora epigaea]|uniref:Uncharacterized protein n=1 Tax=Diversispora epigaea TaxID=1348612 RepID=A0A397JMJ3_9GLOM|nr:hypothetical protein Glove_54g110 [Diversispora epigaea]
MYFSSISKLQELDYINEVRIKVQELSTRITEQTKPLFPIITYEHEISSWVNQKSRTYSLKNSP